MRKKIIESRRTAVTDGMYMDQETLRRQREWDRMTEPPPFNAPAGFAGIILYSMPLGSNTAYSGGTK